MFNSKHWMEQSALFEPLNPQTNLFGFTSHMNKAISLQADKNKQCEKNVGKEQKKKSSPPAYWS